MPRKHSPFSLLKRGDIYYVRVWDPHQKKYTIAKSTGEKNKRAAEIIAARMITEGIITTKGQPLLIDYIIEKITSSRNSKKYKDEGIRYIDKYCRMSPEFSRLRLTEIQNKHLNRLVNFLREQELTGRTVNRIISYIKPCLKTAFMCGYIDRDPTAGKIEKLSENTQRRGSLNSEEIKKIIMIPDGNDYREKPYMVIAILTGMRKGELRALKWHDVEIERGVIYVRQSYTDENGMTAPKTEDSIREIPILMPVRDALEQLLKHSPYTNSEDFVFYQTNRENPIPAHFADKAFCSILDSIGIDEAERKRRHLVPHSTRHSFVTFCRTLLPDFIVGGISGHTTTQMIDNYGRSTAEHFRSAREVLNAALVMKQNSDEPIH